MYRECLRRRLAHSPTPGRPRTTVLLLVTALLLIYQPASAETYRVTFSGAASGAVTVEHAGVGMGHAAPNTNWLDWIEYLGPTSARIFVTTIADWQAFITARRQGSWGRSFYGRTTVADQASWEAAVAEVRGASGAPGSPDFFDWLEGDTSVRWGQFKATLWPRESNKSPPSGPCAGFPGETIARLTAAGIRVLGLWHVTCKNLEFTTADRSSAAYWAERWELYRWFYLGGRFFAGAGVEDIELYNEPNLYTCIAADVFLDDIRVRSLALQHAFEDHNRRTGAALRPVVIGPSISAPRLDYGTHGLAFGRMAIEDASTKFPDLDADPSWRNIHEFAYHQYNTPGYGMRSAWDKVVASVKEAAGPMKVPVRITEHNAWAARTAEEEAPGRDVMDTPATAAILAGQVAALTGRATYTSVHKVSQTVSGGSAGVAKNGLLWADLGQDRSNPEMCNLGGISRAGEAYRLLLRRTPRRRPLLAHAVTPPLASTSNFSTYTTSNNLGYYIHVINGAPTAHKLTLEVGALPGVRAGTPVVVSAVDSTHHGEVYAIRTLQTLSSMPKSRKAVLALTLPPGTVAMATVPRGSYLSSTFSASNTAMVSAGANSGSVQSGSGSPLPLFFFFFFFHPSALFNLLVCRSSRSFRLYTVYIKCL